MKKILILIAIFSVIALSQQQRVTVIEKLSNASCSSCAFVNRTLVPNLQGQQNVLLLTYPWHDGGHYDPMGIFALDYVRTRMANYYKMPGFPYAAVNGQNSQFAGNIRETNFETMENSEINVEIQSTIEGTSFNSNVTIEALTETGALYSPDLKVFPILYESEIIFDNPPGSNGEREFHNVVRYILTDNSGEKANLSLENKSNQFEFSREIDIETINTDKLFLAVLVQDLNSGLIYQAQTSKVEAVSSVESTDQGLLYPNPSNNNIRPLHGLA